jgi:hypothetical protein
MRSPSRLPGRPPPDLLGALALVKEARVHSGTHIDALALITCGEKHEWFGGGNSEEHLGDFGPLRGDATEIPPLIARGC